MALQAAGSKNQAEKVTAAMKPHGAARWKNRRATKKPSMNKVMDGFRDVVPGAGIEPARLAAGDFESPASTNFTTRAARSEASNYGTVWL
jgi:hypothetical protein